MMTTQDEHRALIASYLSGTATREEVERVEVQMSGNAKFRSLFEEMEQSLIPAFDSITPIAPPKGALDRILSEIDRLDETIIEHDFTKTARQSGPEPWRTISILTSMAAAVAIAFHLVPQAQPPQSDETSQLLALMTGEEQPGILVVIYDTEDRRILAKLSNTTLPEDSVWQLWLIRDGVNIPVSLGLMDTTSETGAIEIALQQDLKVDTDLLAISLEPSGGSQLAGPSGPVIYTGKVEPL